jgi:hypothetical protein
MKYSRLAKNICYSFLIALFSIALATGETNQQSEGIIVDHSQLEFKTDQDIFVVGDVHGAFDNIFQALRTVNLIDSESNWSGGKSHFVSLGDLMDRGPASRQVMDLFIKLQTQAAQQGGRFHVVLGNHEVMNLVGDLRYLSKHEVAEFAIDETTEMRDAAYAEFLSTNRLSDSPKLKSQFDASYPKGYFARLNAFSSKGKYGRWLLELPFVIRINESLFAHGGLSKLTQEYSLKAFNEEAKNGLKKYIKQWKSIARKEKLSTLTPYKQRAELIKSLNKSKLLKRYSRTKNHFILNSQGPTWYRGNALCHPYFEQTILTDTLNNWSANQLWVGHTTSQSRQPLTRLEGKLKIMDTGMLSSYYQGTPWIAKISNDKDIQYINGLTGKRAKPQLSPSREWGNPFNLSDQQVEDFLRTATVKKVGKTQEGKTRPFRVELSKDGKMIKGIFKYFDSSSNTRSKRKKLTSDRFHHEIAAYKLDRMLKIGLVPVTIERTVNGQRGIIQVWIDGLISELDMLENNISYSGYCDQESQEKFLNAFDYLIANRDRNQSNVLYTQDDMQIWFIDHSRAFGIKSQRTRPLRGLDISVSQPFKDALENLSMEQLETIRPWLETKQLEAILERRDKMLANDF